MSNLKSQMLHRAAVWLAVAACLVLFVALRMRGVGHLLMWDEARDVLIPRALADGSGDGFTARIWVHPPALPALSLLVQPLAPGFAERYEMLALAINACAMVALFLLNRRIFGAAMALWSCFLLAVMPGAVFYDVWIKGGSIVSLATIGAVAALMGGKPLLSGLCLGFALLDKETAVLPCVAVGILALLDQRHRNIKNIAGLVGITLCTAGWWYLTFSTTMLTWFKFATGNYWDPSCNAPWYSHFAWLYGDLGAAGAILLVLGAVLIMGRKCQEHTMDVIRPYAWWPLLLTVLTLGGLTACRNKSQWFAMFLFPALATLQAAGLTASVSTCIARFPRYKPLWQVMAAACAAVMLALAANRQFADEQLRVMGLCVPVAARTRDLADAVNTRIAPNERLLASTLSFYGPYWHQMLSPIFVFYLTNVPRLMVSYRATPDYCIEEIFSNRLDWALLSPGPGAHTAALTNCFKIRLGLDPIILDNGSAFLYRTTSAYQK